MIKVLLQTFQDWVYPLRDLKQKKKIFTVHIGKFPCIVNTENNASVFSYQVCQVRLETT